MNEKKGKERKGKEIQERRGGACQFSSIKARGSKREQTFSLFSSLFPYFFSFFLNDQKAGVFILKLHPFSSQSPKRNRPFNPSLLQL